MLNLSARGDYGLMFLKFLSALPPGGYATVRTVAEAKSLPIKYLEQVAAALARAGVLRSREGSGGGYALARPPDELKLVEVLGVLEGELEPVRCTHSGECCNRQQACEHKTGWQTMHSKLYDILAKHTLADILSTIHS
jgi:Rrf2 family protein